MKHARKMVIIPADQYENESLGNHLIHKNSSDRSLHSKLENETSENGELNSIQTKGDNLSRLDSEMYNILFSQKYNNDYEKSINYLQVLRRYLHFKENERKEFQPEEITKYLEDINPNEKLNTSTIESDKSFINQASTDNGFTIKSILDSVPRSYQKKAQILLETWKETGKVNWDENGVTSIDGSVIANSNIKDLLNHVTRKRINADDPKGIKDLVRFIFKEDAPINLIGNTDVIKQIKEMSTPKKNKSQKEVTSFMSENNKGVWISA